MTDELEVTEKKAAETRKYQRVIFVYLVLGVLTFTFLFFANIWWLPWFLKSGDKVALTTREALSCMLAASLGSLISALTGYLKHVSVLKDFDISYAPWYPARLLMGMTVGLIFYCLIKGGLLLVIVGTEPIGDLNLWSLAGIGALVGLFSKNALDKLRELFDTLLRTNTEEEPLSLLMLVSRLSLADREAMMNTLPDAVKPAILLGEQQVQKAFSTLTTDAIQEVRKKLPGASLAIFGKFI